MARCDIYWYFVCVCVCFFWLALLIVTFSGFRPRTAGLIWPDDSVDTVVYVFKLCLHAQFSLNKRKNLNSIETRGEHSIDGNIRPELSSLSLSALWVLFRWFHLVLLWMWKIHKINYTHDFTQTALIYEFHICVVAFRSSIFVSLGDFQLHAFYVWIFDDDRSNFCQVNILVDFEYATTTTRRPFEFNNFKSGHRSRIAHIYFLCRCFASAWNGEFLYTYIIFSTDFTLRCRHSKCC